MTVRHAIETDTARAVDVIAAELARVRAAVGTAYATTPSLITAKAAAKRLRTLSGMLVNALARQVREAEQAERRQAALGAEVVDDRIRQLRRETGSADLALPVMP